MRSALPIVKEADLDGPSVPSRRSPAPELEFRPLQIDEIDQQAIARWRDLARRSCHHNPFLAPEFLLPAWRHLAADQHPVLMIVENSRDRRWIAAAGVFLNYVTRSVPWPHVITATSLYTFRSGILLDADRAADALDTLLIGMTCGGWNAQTFEIPGLRLDSTLARELSASARRLRYSWQTTSPRKVPAVFPEIISEDYLAAHWSASRRKSLRRSKNRLSEAGPVHLRLVTDPRDVVGALENFLRLEHDSWKGEEGTACRSDQSHESFICEMVLQMAEQGRILISELCAGERVIASAINLTAGTALFAFKIGWDKAWAHASPGVLHESELMLAARDRLRDFTLFDSCATEDSYIASLWPERIPVATGILCASRWTRWSQQCLQTGRSLRRWLRRRK